MIEYLEKIRIRDEELILDKDQNYRGSWKKRGGVGAFMMLARKWDRIENLVGCFNFDIFAGLKAQIEIDDYEKPSDGTILSEIRDLRCYLTLVEAQVRRDMNEPLNAGEVTGVWEPSHVTASPVDGSTTASDVPSGPGTPEDGGHHARQPVEETKPFGKPRDPEDWLMWKEGFPIAYQGWYLGLGDNGEKFLTSVPQHAVWLQMPHSMQALFGEEDDMGDHVLLKEYREKRDQLKALYISEK